MVDSTVAYCFADVYLYIIECILHVTIILTFKLAGISLKATISMAKQLQYGCCEICNVIQVWIFCNLMLFLINIVNFCYIGVVSDTIGYIICFGL